MCTYIVVKNNGREWEREKRHGLRERRVTERE